MKEIELGEKIVTWLQVKGWEVYQEVSIWGKTADIVAVKNNKVWIIECKVSLTFDLLAQACYWKPYANYSSIAIPESTSYKRSKGRSFAFGICKEKGIGVLKLNHHKSVYSENEHWSIIQSIKPKPNDRAKKWSAEHIQSKLLEEQKTYAKAGSPGNVKKFTRFKKTCLELEEIVKDNPGIELKEAVKKIGHHYKTNHSAIASISKYLTGKKKIIENIKMEIIEGKKMLYFLGTSEE